MNEVMHAILTRRSERIFSQQRIPNVILKDLAEAALHAPSGRGLKTWQFFVVSDRKFIGRLAKAIEEELGRPGYDMYEPAALIIPTNLRNSPYGKEDNACALENIFLAAHSYGVGSVWINQLQGICDTQRIRPLLREIGVPEDHVVYGMAALGYADPNAPGNVYREGGEVHYITGEEEQ